MELGLEEQAPLDDGEMSWPQSRRSERGGGRDAGAGALSLSDLNLNRLAGVPRAHEMPSQAHELPSAGCSNPEPQGDVMSWPVDNPSSTAADATDDAAGQPSVLDPSAPEGVCMPACIWTP